MPLVIENGETAAVMVAAASRKEAKKRRTTLNTTIRLRFALFCLCHGCGLGIDENARRPASLSSRPRGAMDSAYAYGA